MRNALDSQRQLADEVNVLPHPRLYRRRSSFPLVLFLAFAAIVTHSVLTAQQQPPPAAPTPQSATGQPFRGGTNFVRVDVYPTHDGTPVEDLTAADFEVAEDGKPQKIETFEHITIEPARSQEERIEPSSPSQANQLAADPHRRVFVVFLDTQHVTIEAAHEINEPLIEFMSKTLGPDDLVGIMTPTMSVDQITFGRRTQVIEDGLRKNWPWGVRGTIKYDETEEKYMTCFPKLSNEQGAASALAQALIDRRRERIALDSLRELVLWLGAIREGRTAVVTVTEGWLLYAPNSKLTELRTDPVTGSQDPVRGQPPPIGVGRGGSLTTKDPTNPYASDRRECEVSAMELSMTDNPRYFRDILGEANRANVSFYPIDPRGLPAFDNPIGPNPPPPITIDRAMLTTRLENLRVLAANTDGIALLDNNDLRSQMRRLAADLTSYYLIGYASTNNKLDGGFRKIRVRVKRPGVNVRARGGYRAPTAGEISTARTAPSVEAARPSALTAELGALERERRTDAASPGPSRSTDVPGEPIFFKRGPSTGNQLQRSANRQFSRTERLHVEMMPGSASAWTGALLDRNGKPLPVPVATGERVDAATGQKWLTADVTLAPLGAGEYALELTTRGDGPEQKILRALRVTQ